MEFTLVKTIIDGTIKPCLVSLKEIFRSSKGRKSSSRKGKKVGRISKYSGCFGHGSGPKRSSDYDVVGMNDVMEQLSAALLKRQPSLNVVVIYGMGGLGKTSLARNLFNSQDVVRRFKCRAWVRFPRVEYTRTDLLQSIIKAFGEDYEEEISEYRNLQQRLHDLLKNHRYLLVLDDVWHEDAWKIIKDALPNDSNGSRLLITTRNKPDSVSENSNEEIRHLFPVRFLTPQESWNLFWLRACLPPQKEASLTTGELVERCGGEEAFSTTGELVERCGGLPVAIVTLADKFKSQEFEKWPDDDMKEEKFWMQISSMNNSISEVLGLSFNHLDQELKKCFLYMSLFPEGYEFDTNKLIHLWVAEDFVLSDEKEVIMEDKAMELLNELIRRCLVYVTETIWGETASKCRVHSLLRVLALQWVKKVNFFDIFYPYVYDTVELSFSSRRYGVHGYLQDYLPHDHPNPNLHTLLFFKHHREYFTRIERLLSKCVRYEYLGVLDLKGIKLGSNRLLLGVTLCVLVNLKFLGLSDTFVREIPSSIGKLKLLQTLEAGGEFSCRLPPETSELKMLRHMHGHFEGPLHIENLDHLQTLKDVDLDHMSKANGINWKTLRELSVRISHNYHSSKAFKPNLLSLETLIVTSKHNLLSPEQALFSKAIHLKNLWLDGSIATNLSKVSQSLTSLIISNSDSKDDPMPILGNLVNLKNLALIESYSWKRFDCIGKGFPSLETLQLSELYELEELKVDKEAMIKLQKLIIYKCNKLPVPARFEGTTLHLLKPPTGSYLREMFIDYDTY